MTVVLGVQLPITGWWPELNVHAPAAQAQMLLAAPAVAMMPALTATIG